MEPTDIGIELEPRYSTNEIAGKCLKCLGEAELNFCLRELLRGECEDEAMKRRYELLVGFLTSPDFDPLRRESERLLSEGKRVAVRVEPDPATGHDRYTLVIKSEETCEED
jgi:hypothetical protein